MKSTPIAAPLPGEHLVAVWPKPKPETDPGARLRLNFWAGRALTADALELEQRNRALRLAARGRLGTAGVVTGLGVSLESPPPAALAKQNHFIHVLPGYGVTATGEDVLAPRPLRVPLDQIPVRGKPGAAIPRAAVLLLRPAEIGRFAKQEADDPCELDLSRDAFADERRVEAAVLWLYPLPDEMLKKFTEAEMNNQRWRNLLAAELFRTETGRSPRQQTIYVAKPVDGPQWRTALRGRVIPPDPLKEERWRPELPLRELPEWELAGLPLALLSTELDPATKERRFFLDREAIVRPGGWPHPRSRPALQLATAVNDAALEISGAGTPAVWRARVEQFAEQLAGLAAEPIGDQAKHFKTIPPAGLLPRAALNFLDTEAARLVPSPAGQPADRVNNSSFFPPRFAVEAVPIPTEDLDAALAASGALAPYDLDAAPEEVRVLVPLPQRVFEPKLLVVEQVDPFFRTETNRLLATRQDWRQRRDFVRARSLALARDISGAKAAAAAAVDAGQLEVEPVEAEDGLGFAKVLGSPLAPESAARITLAAAQAVPGGATFRLRLRLDAEARPSRIEFAVTVGDATRSFIWEPVNLPAIAEPVAGPEAPAPAFAFWQDWVVSAEQLGFAGGEITALKLSVQGGRLAVGRVNVQVAGAAPVALWLPETAGHKIEFDGGEWDAVVNARRLAAFEEEYVPVLDDEPTLAKRIEELDKAANPGDATARKPPLSVKEHGLEKVLTELEAEANEADDFVDANFTRAQTNLYRIRKHILGENAAQRLLINPAIATIAEQETASATATQLSSFIATAKKQAVTADAIRTAFTPPAGAAPPPGNAAFAPAAVGSTVVSKQNPGVKNVVITKAPDKKGVALGATVIKGETLGKITTGSVVEDTQKASLDLGAIVGANLRISDVLDNVRGQLPELGPVLPPRGLSLGERFIEPPATKNLSYARAALQDVLDQLPKLRLPLVVVTVKSLDKAKDVALLTLQGRDKAKAREVAMRELLAFEAKDTDEAEVTLAALDLIDIKSAILRLIERVVVERRAVLARGGEALVAIRLAALVAQNRLTLLEGKLAEARHDVTVARALWREEVDRVDGINDRRDALLANEVKFLAYVRPRTVDPVRRDLPAWRLDPEESPTPMPACRQRHDEPPELLAAYVQLFRHAPVRWFPEIAGQLAKLDTKSRLTNLLAAAKDNATRFLAAKTVPAFNATPAAAVLATFQASFSLVQAQRQLAATASLVRPELKTWLDQRRDVEEQASLGDLIEGQHGQKALASAAAKFLEQIEQVATCLHAEFAAVAPAMRLRWVERYSQFDQPAPLRELTILPGYGQLARDQRRRFQDFVNWLFARVNAADTGAFSLVNDLVRLCLLLASHAPVNQIITGHLPRPTPVRPGVLIPIRPLNPALVRVGMEFHVWNGPVLAARGRVEDLHDGEVSARVEQAHAATLDAKMQVQFVASALSLVKRMI